MQVSVILSTYTSSLASIMICPFSTFETDHPAFADACWSVPGIRAVKSTRTPVIVKPASVFFERVGRGRPNTLGQQARVS